MNAAVIKKNRHAFDFGLNGGKIWIRYIGRDLWTLHRFEEVYFDSEDAFYVADDANTEFAKAVIDGKRIEIYEDDEWTYSLCNDIDFLLRCGFTENCTYRIMPERWKPEKGGVYHFVNIRGEAGSDFWLNCELDKQRYEIGNCFQTLDQATEMAEKIKQLFRSEL